MRSYSIASPPEAQRIEVTIERLDDGSGIDVTYTYTRSQPPGWTGYRRRIDEAMLQEVAPLRDTHPHIYICGPTPLAEGAANGLVALGYEPAMIRIERFGPTGR